MKQSKYHFLANTSNQHAVAKLIKHNPSGFLNFITNTHYYQN